MSEARYSAHDLITFATHLLEKVDLPSERAQVMAEMLVEADLMGHSTHGLNLLGPYLQELENGGMTKTGDPAVIADHGASLTWDGRYLPGPWLVVRALELACERVKQHPVVTISIQRSHHIACLAAYLKAVTDQGYLLILACSDPNESAVAPFGGMKPVYSPDPLAVGIPTKGDPILIDISASTTAMGVVRRALNEGKRLPGAWLLDNQGHPTDDPAEFFTEPRGSVLPLGGIDLGYKGFALGLLIEALTGALSGHGRSDPVQQWGASVFIQVMDPAAFGGRDTFLRETEWIAEQSRTNPPRPGHPPVRLPGERGLQRRAEQLENGVTLYPAILPSLQPWSEKLGVPMPAVFPE